MSFRTFLKKQIGRDDLVGDIAKDCFGDAHFPWCDSYSKMRNYIENRTSWRSIHDAFDEAWFEYKDDCRDGLTFQARFAILRRDNFQCQLCGHGQEDGAKLEIDHKHPKSLGGTNELQNLWTLCKACNRGKSNLELNELAEKWDI